MPKQAVVEDSTAAVTEQAAEIAADVEASTGGEQRRDTVTLSNGVILKVKPVPPLALQEVARRFTRPTIPEVYNADKGRMEENPIHPAYLEALERYQADQIMAATDVMLMIGTEIVSIPEGVDPPEGNNWVELRELMGLDTDFKNKYHRYIAWLRQVLVTNNDIAITMAAAIALNGVMEVEVQQAVAAFRNRPGR